jgi:peptidyl-prolyl cis-trans isomerase C
MRKSSSLGARLVVAAGLGLLAAAWEGPAPHADTSPAGGPVGGPVVATVGTVSITAADLERRIGAVPGFQLRTFGANPAEIKRNFLERVLVREALLSQGGTDQGLANREDIRDRSRGVLRSALLSKLRNEVLSASRIDERDVRAYYDKNSTKFHSPERYALWWIATRTQDEAKEVIADLKKDPSPKHWGDLARTKSIDGPTAFRRGDLGFVAPDGTTAEPGLKVSHAVLEAVEKLKDAEISPEPVADGNRWVVVWRKQTMRPVDRPMEIEAGSIKQMLMHMRTEAKIKEVVAELRKKYLGEHNPDLVDLFDITPQGDLAPVRRPGALPTGKRAPVNAVPGLGSLR